MSQELDTHYSSRFQTESMNCLLYKSSTLILNNFEILANVSISGCEVLVHHFETVEGVIPNCSDNHLLVFFFSTRSNFRRLISSIWLVRYCNFCKVSEFFSIYRNLMGKRSFSADYLWILYSQRACFR